MVDNFKESIKQINSLTWIILSIVFTMLIINPIEQKEFPVLGIKISVERSLVIVPTSILLLTTVRGIIIRNAIFIFTNINKIKEITTVKEFVNTYPLLEFLRWKAKDIKSIVLLTIFQSIIDIFPGIAIITYPLILESYSFGVKSLYKVILEVIGLITTLIAVRNYSLLRRKIYEPLLGKINTPD
jgi:hypothetical protein